MLSRLQIQSKLHIPIAQEIRPFWHEKKILWDNSGNYEPKSIATTGSWYWDFNFPIPRHFDNSMNGGYFHTVLPGDFNLKVFPNQLCPSVPSDAVRILAFLGFHGISRSTFR